MKLTPAEYNLLDTVIGCPQPISWLKPAIRRVASKMRMRGLISKRAWDKGHVAATALGRRSYSYGKR